MTESGMVDTQRDPHLYMLARKQALEVVLSCSPRSAICCESSLICVSVGGCFKSYAALFRESEQVFEWKSSLLHVLQVDSTVEDVGEKRNGGDGVVRVALDG